MLTLSTKVSKSSHCLEVLVATSDGNLVTIPVGPVADVDRACSRALSEVSSLARMNEFKGKVELGEAEASAILKRLAPLGEAILTTDVIRKLTGLIETRGENAITALIDETLWLPWELICGSDSKTIPVYTDFWGCKYRIYRRFSSNPLNEIEPDPSIRVKHERPNILLPPCYSSPDASGREVPYFKHLHTEKIAKVQVMGPLDPTAWDNEFAFLCSWLDDDETEIVHFAGLLDIPVGQPGSDYQLVLDANFPIPARKLGTRPAIKRQSTNPLGVVVLNVRCNGQRDPMRVLPMISTLLNLGTKGVVASVYPIPDSFAAAFIEKFYRRFLGGCEIGEALSQTKRLFVEDFSNPLALLYSPFVNLDNPTLRLESGIQGIGFQGAMMDQKALRARFRQRFTERFNEEDLRSLCFDMGIDYESLPAQGKAGKAREIVVEFERRGEIAYLIAYCRRVRPNESWEDLTETTEVPVSPSDTGLSQWLPNGISAKVKAIVNDAVESRDTISSSDASSSPRSLGDTRTVPSITARMADSVPEIRPESTVPIKGVVLHLSDLHFGPKHRFSPANYDKAYPREDVPNIASSLMRDIQSLQIPIDALVISGDLTQTGQSSEFTWALDALEQFVVSLGISKEQVVIVPGNHDVEWLSEEAKKLPSYDSINAYKMFYRSFYRYAPVNPRKMYHVSFVKNKNIAILGLDSRVIEDAPIAGVGYIGSSQLEEALQRLKSITNGHADCVKIAVLHHHLMPVAQLEHLPGNGKQFSLVVDAAGVLKRLYQEGFALVLHGHQHQPYCTDIRLHMSKLSRRSSMTILGAGSIGADRSELGSIARNHYNIIEFRTLKNDLEIRVTGRMSSGDREDEYVPSMEEVFRLGGGLGMLHGES